MTVSPETPRETLANRLFISVATAAAVALLLYFPDREDGSGATLGGLMVLLGVPLVLVPLARYRPLPKRSSGEHGQLMLRALTLGVGLGVANLLVNYGLALSRSAIYDQMIARWAQFSTWSVVIAGPIIEEVSYRLILLGVLAWLASRFTTRPRTITFAALGVSSALFGVAHVFYGGVDDPVYMVGMALKSAAGGLLLGWIFWRWGLAYSIAAHCAANGTHLLLMPALFQLSVESSWP
jgi:membrane protease YdiL (CAAX protease family)